MSMMRFCPNCQTERSLYEIFCEGQHNGHQCGWDLSREAIRETGWRPALIITAEQLPSIPNDCTGLTCRNGHPIEAGDLICLTCGEDVAAVAEHLPTSTSTSDDSIHCAQSAPNPSETSVNDWRLLQKIAESDDVFTRYHVEHRTLLTHATLTLYAVDREPNSDIYDVLKTLPREHVPEIIESGRWQGQAYVVTERLSHGSLADAGIIMTDVPTIKHVVSELGSALNCFAQAGLRLCDLRPETLLVRTNQPLDLVVTDFGSARLSEFDLDIISPLTSSYYMAPETVVGGVSMSSDWWSLGMILLEQLTDGACFQHVNQQAFMIHILTNGVVIPDHLDSDIQLLLRGLLTKNHHQRWQWLNVQAWLKGEIVASPASRVIEQEVLDGVAIELNRRFYRKPEHFALAAAEHAHWQAATELLLNGSLLTWLTQIEYDISKMNHIRFVIQQDSLPNNAKLMLALKVLNQDMPLVWEGEIVSSPWLLKYPIEGYQLISGMVPAFLRQLNTESWLWQLHERIAIVFKRAKNIEIELVDDFVKIHLLSTSRTQLLAQWQERWQLFPDAIHPGVLSLMERTIISDEDLIILLSCSLSLFRSADNVLLDINQQVKDLNILAFSAESLPKLILQPRVALYKELNERIIGFAKTGYDEINQWVEQYRLEKRLPLNRLLLLLGIEKQQWRQPEEYQYITQIMDYFSKKVATAIMLGPLVRMRLGPLSSRVDLSSLGTETKPSDVLLNHLLTRNVKPCRVDPMVFSNNNPLNRRMVNLQNQCRSDFRDSGVNGLYMGFPFLYYKESHVNRLPRIAPVFLWPLNINSELGATQNTTLAFDNQREEVRINPALEHMLGKSLFTRLSNKLDELMIRSTLHQHDVMDMLSDMGLVLNHQLIPLPENTEIESGKLFFDCVAVIFNVNFVGQVIGEDLRFLKQLSPTGTGLETAMRLNTATENLAIVDKPPEHQRFLTVASDPSQENAIFKARQAPGLLIEGPPGTGKSQTIVNMVADAIGRNKTLLIVCQKKAALDVVYKRLVAEKLASRSLMINAINTDRQAIISSVREQVVAILKGHNEPIDMLVRAREQQANFVSSLEQRLDEVYQSVHHQDNQIGLNYRQLISELIYLSRDELPFSAPQLRQSLQDLNLHQLMLLENECAPLIRYWLPAHYENNPLIHLSLFSHDTATINDFLKTFNDFLETEKSRVEILALHQSRFDFDEPTPYKAWIKTYAQDLLAITEPVRGRLNKWLSLFNSDRGAQILHQLNQVLEQQQTIRHHVWHDISPTLIRFTPQHLQQLILYTQVANSARSWLSILNVKRKLYCYRVKRTLNELGYHFDAQTLNRFLQALQLEQQYRPIRDALNSLYQQLDLPPYPAEMGHSIGDDIRLRIAQLQDVQQWAVKLSTSPAHDDIEQAVLNSTQAVNTLLQDFDAAFVRYEAKVKSINSLITIKSYLNSDIYEAANSAICHHQSTPLDILMIQQHLSEVYHYQYFRVRSRHLSSEAMTLLMHLRTYHNELEKMPEHQLEQSFRQVLNFEARLSWKSKLEQETPALLADNQEHEQYIAELLEADKGMRHLNRQFLNNNIDRSALASLGEWEAITRLTGQRALRLREFINRGIGLGLMSVRPVWLMTPDVASQVLPLKAGLFDVVIYDEASQMPVEYALPTLYRAKTIIVSGDEKQMPPTSFFSSQIQMDEEESPDLKLSYEEISEKEQKEQENLWNQREIIDCPDLLQLGRSVLPSTTLQVHYRSNYRELIHFSNVAFYAKRLNVPVRHSKETLQLIKPIELIQINGIYKDQSNLEEAQCVIEQISTLWQVDASKRPTIGVVTFNKKQAELISTLIHQRIAEDEMFKQTYIEEINRQDSGEDMSFFIKNVENVQGDERDIIIFSTTFGRNESGTFRRHFGVLGQQGGERRLNVAITRAKHRVMIISSMPIDAISDMLETQRPPQSPRDYLQSYLEYARTLTHAQWQQNKELLNRFHSIETQSHLQANQGRDGFLNDVAKFLDTLNISYDQLSTNDVFSLDFAIKDPQTNLYILGIECDPPHHPLLANARSREIWRINVLKRSLPDIFRISSASWFSHKDQIQQTLKQLIDKLNNKE